MDSEMRASADWQGWRRRLIEVVGEDYRLLDAATDAALTASRQGAGDTAATAAGRAAARMLRESRVQGLSPPNDSPPPPRPRGAPTMTPSRGTVSEPSSASSEIARRIFDPPQRWGWRAAPAVAEQPLSPRPERPPDWINSPLPDAPDLRMQRAKAVSKLVRLLAFATIFVAAFVAYRLILEKSVARYGKQAELVYTVALAVVGALILVAIIRAIAGVSRANRAIRSYEQPGTQLRAAEKERHRQAVRQWEQAVRQHEVEERAAAEAQRDLSRGPHWYPVCPLSDPLRVDVIGGDPRRLGWASLVVTLGTSMLAGRKRLTVLDLTGQSVARDLADVARVGGYRVRERALNEGGDDVAPLEGIPTSRVARCIAETLVDRAQPTDVRQERALVLHLVEAVVHSLEGRITFARLAAGLQVFRQQDPGDVLAGDEIGRLTERIGDIDQSEWTGRQLRYAVSQLHALSEMTSDGRAAEPLWGDDDLSVVATIGGRDDRRELLDRLLVQLAREAVDAGRWRDEVLVVAGADHLGADTLQIFSQHARTAGVRLVLMIDHPQGDLEKDIGSGGAVCIMKMYNHRDATVAAEFVGRGHQFVLNQITRQVGKSFTDGGGDSFSSNSSQGSSSKSKSSGRSGAVKDLSESRGQAWSAVRNWSMADNISTSTSSSRVYEFTVEPSEVLAMPETAFLLVDNSGQGRRILLADANPGICLLERVSKSLA